MNEQDQKLMIEQMRKHTSEAMAKELVSVQPMPSDILKDALVAGKDQKWLEENDYQPVSRLGLLWVKK